LRTPTDSRKLRRIGALAMVAALAALPAAPATAGSGGVGSGGSGGGGGDLTTSGSKAKLVHGKAIAPESAPTSVKRAIAAANDIAKGKGYCLGGGHSSWKSSCYDCSGAVSYALHGGRLLDHPLDSSGLARWASKGRGHWISVYGNSGHAFMTIAGLRFDTSDTHGAGPGWARGMGYENPNNYAKRHKARL
jgi:hypothetical protein